MAPGFMVFFLVDALLSQYRGRCVFVNDSKLSIHRVDRLTNGNNSVLSRDNTREHGIVCVLVSATNPRLSVRETFSSEELPVMHAP